MRLTRREFNCGIGQHAALDQHGYCHACGTRVGHWVDTRQIVAPTVAPLLGLDAAVDGLGQSISALDIWAENEAHAGTLSGDETCEIANAVWFLKQTLDCLRQVCEERQKRARN